MEYGHNDNDYSRFAGFGGQVTSAWLVAIVAVTYLFDVKPQGGGTCYFPGSHRAVHSWMCDHPDEYRSGENLQGWGMGDEFGEKNLASYDGVRPAVENVMRAGKLPPRPSRPWRHRSFSLCRH